MTSLLTFREQSRWRSRGRCASFRGTIAVYPHDASNYRQVPIGVVMPRHAEDVISTINLAREEMSSLILARGGGTALGGQADQRGTGAGFFEVHEPRARHRPRGENRGRVQPGVIQSALNSELAPHGPFLRTRSFHQGLMHHRRDDRQQLLRRAFGRVRQNRR